MHSETFDSLYKNGFLSRLSQDRDFRLKILYTGFVMWMFITMGWGIAIIGSTFPDLRLIMDKDLETASWLFTLSNLGYLIGALVGGVLVDRYNRLLFLSASVALCAVFIGVIPLCEDFPVMLFVNFMNGLFNGGMDVGGNSIIGGIWDTESAPYFQVIHFGFSFGGVISPLTADPFLADKFCAGNNDNMVAANDKNTSTTTSTTLRDIHEEWTHLNESNNSNNQTACNDIFGETNVQYAYLIAGLVTLSAAVPFLILNRMSSTNQVTSSEQKQTEPTSTLPEISIGKKVYFITLLMFLISTYGSVEGRFSGLLSTFVSNHLGWSTNKGLHITTLFWGTFAAGRFIGIFVTKCLNPATILAIYLLSLTASLIGLLFAAIKHVAILIWVFTALSGLSMSAIYPSIFTWTAQSILVVTGKISSVYVIGVSVANMLFPLLYGHLMDKFTQMYFVYLLLGQVVLCLLIYVVILLTQRVLLKPKVQI